MILLITVSVSLGLIGLGAFLWSLRSGQYEDLEGDAQRFLADDTDKPLPPRKNKAKS